MAFIILEVAAILILPIFFKVLAKRINVLKTVGPIILCYGAGILIGNIGIPWDKSLSMSISEIAVPLAIPLILFSLDLKKWLSLAKKTILSFVLMIISAAAAAIIAALIFSGKLEEGWKISGMLTGCYTGGTPNLMAIGMGLNVNSETLVMVNTCDMVLGGCYFFLMVSVVKLGLRKILPKFKSTGDEHKEEVAALQGIFSNGKRNGDKGAASVRSSYSSLHRFGCGPCFAHNRTNGCGYNHTGGNHLRHRPFFLEKNQKHAGHLEHGPVRYIGVFHGDRLHRGHTAVFQLISPHFGLHGDCYVRRFDNTSYFVFDI